MSKPDVIFSRMMLKAILTWFVDAGYEKSLFVIDSEGCEIDEVFLPHCDDLGHITLNLSAATTRNMVMDEEGVSFETLKHGISRHMFVPYDCILGYTTNYGFAMFTYLPAEIWPVEDKEANDTAGPQAVDYKPKMVSLDLTPEEKQTIRTEGERTLKLIASGRKVPTEKVAVDPKSPSYPFPEDRFATYNATHQDREAVQDDKKDVMFTGNVAGINFNSRAKKPRVRPDWLTVIEGGK